ncbi:amine dehydrogenase large subunit [Pseudorhodoferax sp.]|uniref:amine dehydrogenase large subunit n=1 Tax=Pseudorhodoferax sp. TaxID=1993553 RepID=UPI002DD62CC3|nr:amine dehydrogenase large subunit [Pseudorhodoferax sp.]
MPCFPRDRTQLATGLRRLLAGTACLAALLAARAELPAETITMARLPPVDRYRIYLSDPAMGHLVDGRAHVIDGSSMRYLGLLGTGFAGATAQSRDGQTLFVATTFHSRLVRGTRTDVVEVYSAEDLVFSHEIEIPTKRVQGLPMRALLATTVDDRLLLVQNATPATSVTVVDLAARRTLVEIPTPGCYGVIPWPRQPRRFSSVCGDGTLATYDIGEAGAPVTTTVSAAFFDADQDPVFMHYELVGDQLTLLSYHGNVYQIDLGGAQAVAAAPWSLLDAEARRRHWRPGGYQLFAIEPRSGRLYVAMHSGGAEGTHKNPAQEIWTIDLAQRKRIARMPGRTAVALDIARTETPRLFLLSAADNRIVSFDVGGARPPARPLARSEPLGETPIYLGLR